MNHEDRRLGIPSKLGARMQTAQDRACPRPVPVRMQGFRVHEQGLQAYRGRQARVRLPPPPPPEKGRRRRRRRKKIIRMPGVTCSRRTSKNCRAAYARPNLLRDAQAYACLAKKCGRSFTHDDGFRHRRTRPSRSRRPSATEGVRQDAA